MGKSLAVVQKSFFFNPQFFGLQMQIYAFLNKKMVLSEDLYQI